MKITKEQKAKLNDARIKATEVMDELKRIPEIELHSRMMMKLQSIEHAVVFLENALLL